MLYFDICLRNLSGKLRVTEEREKEREREREKREKKKRKKSFPEKTSVDLLIFWKSKEDKKGQFKYFPSQYSFS